MESLSHIQIFRITKVATLFCFARLVLLHLDVYHWCGLVLSSFQALHVFNLFFYFRKLMNNYWWKILGSSFFYNHFLHSALYFCFFCIWHIKIETIRSSTVRTSRENKQYSKSSSFLSLSSDIHHQDLTIEQKQKKGKTKNDTHGVLRKNSLKILKQFLIAVCHSEENR